MLELYKQVVANQFGAEYKMLSLCVEACPESAWKKRLANFGFGHAVYHTLFFSDLLLSPDEESFRAQSFHRQHPEFFNDYDELSATSAESDQGKELTQAYLEHCRLKAAAVVEAETAESLASETSLPWLEMTRAELHVYNLRHIQHHTAQLSLHLRRDGTAEIPWVKSGWPD